VFGRYVSAAKVEALRLELIRAGLVARDDGQAPYEVGHAIKTGDPDKTTINLKFLVETGLISSAKIKGGLQVFLEQLAKGEARSPTLPASGSSTNREDRYKDNEIYCYSVSVPETRRSELQEQLTTLLREPPLEAQDLREEKNKDKWSLIDDDNVIAEIGYDTGHLNVHLPTFKMASFAGRVPTITFIDVKVYLAKVTKLIRNVSADSECFSR